MSLTSDRFCIYLRKDADNTELLKFINGQKSLSASIRLLIKAYMATAKTLDVESADLFDVIDSVSAKNLGLLDPNTIAGERMADKNRAAKVVAMNHENQYDFEEDSEADIVSEDVIERPETLVVTNIQNPRENQEPHKLEETKGSAPVVETKNEDSGGSINDFMGDF